MPFIVEVTPAPGPDYENRILNPSAESEFSPDYGYDAQLPDMFARFQADDGAAKLRRLTARGRVFNFQWNRRPSDVKYAFEQWEAQFESAFFHLADWEKGRYFAGMFSGPLVYSPAGNEQWNIKGQFVELPGKAMYEYPANWDRDAIMLDEIDDDGEDLVNLSGAWTIQAGAANHRGAAYCNGDNVAGAFAEWLYFGYGVRFWARQEADGGQAHIYVDGALVAAVDFSTAVLASSPLVTKADLPLGLHRVRIVQTGAAGAGTGFSGGGGHNVYADAIQVMR